MHGAKNAIDNLMPVKEKPGNNYFRKLEQSEAPVFIGNLESHVHAQCRIHAQDGLEKTLNINHWLFFKLNIRSKQAKEEL